MVTLYFNTVIFVVDEEYLFLIFNRDQAAIFMSDSALFTQLFDFFSFFRKHLLELVDRLHVEKAISKTLKENPNEVSVLICFFCVMERRLLCSG